MKIYFAASIRGGREDVDKYYKIIEFLNTKGTVLTEHVGNKTLSSSGEVNITEEFIHDRDLKWLKDSDLIVAEVSNPSLGVGYELGIASQLNKRVICLFNSNTNRKLSAMIRGNKNF